MPTHTKQHGMRLLRRLSEKESQLLQEVFKACKVHLPKKADMIYWFNLYLNKEFRLDYRQRQAFHQWVNDIVREAHHDWPELHIISYNFVINPAGNQNFQPFHYDYKASTSNLFVPLTKITPRNALQFLPKPLERAKASRGIHNDELGSLEEIMEAEGCDAIEVSQLICHPFSLIQLFPHTPHRGISNGEDYDRVLFEVTVDDHYHDIKETTAFQYSTSKEAPIM